MKKYIFLFAVALSACSIAKADVTKAKQDQVIKNIRSQAGSSFGDGECYALTGEYAYELDGKDISYSNNHPMRGLKGGGVAASDIAVDWDWSGWSIDGTPTNQELKVGQIYTISPFTGGVWQTGDFGHTGVITGLDPANVEVTQSNTFNTHKITVEQYSRSDFLTGVNYLITPNVK